jgi:hypothetical protein
MAYGCSVGEKHQPRTSLRHGLAARRSEAKKVVSAPPAELYNALEWHNRCTTSRSFPVDILAYRLSEVLELCHLVVLLPTVVQVQQPEEEGSTGTTLSQGQDLDYAAFSGLAYPRLLIQPTFSPWGFPQNQLILFPFFLNLASLLLILIFFAPLW